MGDGYDITSVRAFLWEFAEVSQVKQTRNDDHSHLRNIVQYSDERVAVLEERRHDPFSMT